MARNETYVAATADDVFAVLSDPACYADWVVGTEDVRSADGEWPAPGARFRYRVGLGPLALAGYTVVEEAQRPVHLQLRAVLPPIGSARIRLDVQPDGRGSRVTLVEGPGDLRSRVVFTPLAHLLVRLRNVHSLARLRALAEARPAG